MSIPKTLLLGLALLLALPVPGQDSPPEVVAVADIPLRAQEAMLELGEMEARLAPQPLAQKADEESEEPHEALTALPRPWEESDEFVGSARTLSEARREWLRVRDRVNERQSDLQERARDIGAEQKALREMGELWSRTREEAETVELPETVGARVDAVLARIAHLRELARERLDPLLATQESLSEAAEEIDEGITRLDDLMARTRARLFPPERAPLWTLRAWERDELTLSGQLRESYRRNRATLIE